MKKKGLIFLSIIVLILLIIGIGMLNKRLKSKEENNNSHTPVKTTEYNLKLIKTVNQNKNENYLISPYSIEIALSLLKAGADGNTLTEIENVIGNREINDVTIKDHVGVANAAFIKEEYKKYVLDSYLKTLTNNYHSEILYDEFATPKLINAWVEEKTNGMIDKILDDIDKDFILGLANAIAIDVEWSSPFECNLTKEQAFTKIDGTKYNVEMMHKTLEYSGYKYLESDDAKGVIIPYKSYNKTTGKEDYDDENYLEFIAILPNDNINSYINELDNNKLSALLSSGKEVSNKFEIDLSLPRFKYDYELGDFKEVLKSLGIKDACDEELANFTKIMPRSAEIPNLYVGEAIHKTHIDLNEKGTKAAAVTYFGVFKSSGISKEKEKVSIVFDKPFIYMIRDHKTNELLFFGTVYEPNEWQGTTCTEEE